MPLSPTIVLDLGSPGDLGTILGVFSEAQVLPRRDPVLRCCPRESPHGGPLQTMEG
jgi:hypothetical protein